ncbi:MAG: hypothetical protein J2P28_20615, partial [Actinobacteria bacterium]|nr:hypothetical protein [Actinomycetota bacterium]
LCVMVQSYPSIASATAGGTASFVVWVWSLKAASSNVSVVGSIAASSFVGSPSFTICPSISGATCILKSLPLGQVYELLASAPLSTTAPLAGHVIFSAKATASGALPFTASATDVVVAASNATLPPFSSSSVPPLLGLPPIPGTSVRAMNPSDLFPTVSPSPGSGTIGLPHARHRPPVHATVLSSTVPVDARLIGAQIAGLAVLAGAVAIAITQLSLRRKSNSAVAAAEAAGATTETAADDEPDKT